ncbi:MAG: ABC transporter substrate-binding protein [Faecousia sp.]
MKRKIALMMILAMMITMLGAMTGCGKADDEYAVVGLIAEITGRGAYTGVPMQLFLEDYFEEINAKGGIQGKKLKLITYDIASDAAVESVNAANRLINEDKAIAILGLPASSSCMAINTICDEAKVPFISVTATNELVTVAEDGTLHPYAYRVCFIDSYQGTAAASYAYNEMDINDVGIIEMLGEAYSQNISDYFEKEFTALGGTVVKRIGVQSTDVEFRAPLTAMADAGVKTLYVSASSYVVPSYMANQAAELGLDMNFIFPDGAFDDALLEVAGSNLEGAVITTGVFANDPVYADFAAEFQKKHPEWNANMFVLYVYDAIKLLEYGINTAGSLDPAKIGEAIGTAKGVELFTDKNFTVDPETHNPQNKTVSVVGIHDSKWDVVASFQPGQ